MLLFWCLYRDFGIFLINLRILWFVRFGFSDLDGISLVSLLKVNYFFASWDKNSKFMGFLENCWKGLRVSKFINWLIRVYVL